MAIDLFTADFLQLTGTTLHDAVHVITRADLPQDDRAQEGYMLDFKEEWGDKSLRVVAAFANTFGGVIVIGVTELKGKADKIVGVLQNSELKTRIAGSIAANISPTPYYEIAECEMPNDPSRRLCVVRVRESKKIHYLLRKGQSPVYVRNEDQAIPAAAAELRQLVQREKESSDNSSRFEENLKPILDLLQVTKATGAGTSKERLQGRSKADSSLKVVVSPERA
jgi:predicted HTH transcriptional regulator